MCLDDAIVSSPLSYRECFELIMGYIDDEIKANNTYDRSGDYTTVKMCLLCHKIEKYTK